MRGQKLRVLRVVVHFLFTGSNLKLYRMFNVKTCERLRMCVCVSACEIENKRGGVLLESAYKETVSVAPSVDGHRWLQTLIAEIKGRTYPNDLSLLSYNLQRSRLP